MAKNLPSMQETRVWSLGQEDPLEKEMATHSNILAWRIPWTEEPGGLRATKNWTRLSDSHTHTDIHPWSPSSKSPAAAAKSLQSNSVRPHRWQPTRLYHPWDSPGKNTGVGRHFLFQFMKVKRESEVAQSCLTLRNPMDCSLPGSSVHRTFQARVLEWVAIAFSEVPCQSY